MAPKKAKLAEAEEQLAATRALLEEKRQELRLAREGLAKLQEKFKETLAKKELLEEEVGRTETKLDRAEKLMGNYLQKYIHYQY